MLVKKENLVAQKLKNSCYKNGKEIDSKKCAKFLHELGLVYRERFLSSESLNEKIYNRKMCVMQCTILLNAAIVRNPENKDQVERDLRQFCFELLEISTAKNKDSDLIMVTNKIKSSIQTMRENIAELSRKIKIIPEDADGITFESLKKEKIKNIKEIQTEVSETFKNIMQDLCRLCIKIMENPPCRFALVGLGSLARKEITPYSDFEHIIVLEDGLEDYENIKEYFRWFALIFQVVLINLGETIVPCADIPSINGGEHSVFKFFDGNTPRGVSPDGMVPYACKNPLGRMFETENKKFTLELIQPVSIMASFIDSEEDIKNGYHLADMLTMACYVAGDIGIYKEFDDLAKQKLKSITRNVSFTSNKKEFMEALKEFHILDSFERTETSVRNVLNIKRMIYRSSTLFISALGRHHEIEAASCFDIIDELFKKSLLELDGKINLEFAVAVACETRLKMYELKNSQDEIAVNTQTHSEIINELGIRSIVEYFVIISTVQSLILGSGLHLEKKLPQDIDYGAATDVNDVDGRVCLILYYLNHYEKAIKEASKHLKKVEDPYFYDILAICYFQLQDYENAAKNYEKRLKHDLPIDSKAHAMHSLGICLLKLEKKSKALEIQEKALKIYLGLSDNKDLDPDVASCYTKLATCKMRLELYSEALEDVHKANNIYQQLLLTKGNKNAVWQGELAYNLGVIANCKNGLMLYTEAFQIYEQSIEMFEKTTINATMNTNLAEVYSNYARCKDEFEYTEEAIDLFQKALDIYRNTSPLAKGDKEVAKILRTIANCKKSIGLLEEAAVYFEESFETLKTLLPDQTQAKGFADYYFHKGEMEAEQNQHEAAMEYFKKALEVNKSVPVNDSNTVHIYNAISKSFYENENNPSESVKYLLKAVETLQAMSKSPANEYETACIFQNLGFYSYSAGHYKEALDYCQKVLLIYENSSLTPLRQHHNLRLANVWNTIGMCKLNLHEYSQAIEALEKSIKICDTISPYPASDVFTIYEFLGDASYSNGLEITSINCYQKAIEIATKYEVPLPKLSLVSMYTKIGDIQYQNELFFDCTISYQKALGIFPTITSNKSTEIEIANTCSKLGAAFLYCKQPFKASEYVQRSQDIIQNENFYDSLSDVYQNNCSILNNLQSVVYARQFCVYKNSI